MSKAPAADEVVTIDIDGMNRQIASQQVENAKLYRLVNLYKNRITDLEIAGIDKDMRIEQLEARAGAA